MKRISRQYKDSLPFGYVRGAGYWSRMRFLANTLYPIATSYVIHEIGFRVARSLTCG
jgi:hypothetical protein